jgi:hypothetical protein
VQVRESLQRREGHFRAMLAKEVQAMRQEEKVFVEAWRTRGPSVSGARRDSPTHPPTHPPPPHSLVLVGGLRVALFPSPLPLPSPSPPTPTPSLPQYHRGLCCTHHPPYLLYPPRRPPPLHPPSVTPRLPFIPRPLALHPPGASFTVAQQRLEIFSKKMAQLQQRITCVRETSVLFKLPPPVFAALRPLAQELGLLSSVFGLFTEVHATSERFWNTLFKVQCGVGDSGGGVCWLVGGVVGVPAVVGA